MAFRIQDDDMDVAAAPSRMNSCRARAANSKKRSKYDWNDCRIQLSLPSHSTDALSPSLSPEREALPSSSTASRSSGVGRLSITCSRKSTSAGPYSKAIRAKSTINEVGDTQALSLPLSEQGSV